MLMQAEAEERSASAAALFAEIDSDCRDSERDIRWWLLD